MVKKIVHNDVLLAIIIPHDFQKEGVEFFTPREFSQQLGYMKHPRGYAIPHHIHRLAVRHIQYTQEALLVKSGRVKVVFYSDEKK